MGEAWKVDEGWDDGKDRIEIFFLIMKTKAFFYLVDELDLNVA